MARFKHILVPVDFTKEAEYGLEWAIRLLGREPGEKITLLNVTEIVPIIEPPYYAVHEVEAMKANAATALEKWRDRIPEGIQTDTLVAEGDPAHEIVKACQQQRVDLAVMTTRGRRGIARIMKPNLAERVVRDAPCPVMVVHYALAEVAGAV